MLVLRTRLLLTRHNDGQPGNDLPPPIGVAPHIDAVTVLLKRLLLVAPALSAPIPFGGYRSNITIDMRDDVGMTVFRDIVTLKSVFKPLRSFHLPAAIPPLQGELGDMSASSFARSFARIAAVHSFVSDKSFASGLPGAGVGTAAGGLADCVAIVVAASITQDDVKSFI